MHKGKRRECLRLHALGQREDLNGFSEPSGQLDTVNNRFVLVDI